MRANGILACNGSRRRQEGNQEGNVVGKKGWTSWNRQPVDEKDERTVINPRYKKARAWKSRVHYT